MSQTYSMTFRELWVYRGDQAHMQRLWDNLAIQCEFKRTTSMNMSLFMCSFVHLSSHSLVFSFTFLTPSKLLMNYIHTCRCQDKTMILRTTTTTKITMVPRKNNGTRDNVYFPLESYLFLGFLDLLFLLLDVFLLVILLFSLTDLCRTVCWLALLLLDLFHNWRWAWAFSGSFQRSHYSRWNCWFIHMYIKYLNNNKSVFDT